MAASKQRQQASKDTHMRRAKKREDSILFCRPRRWLVASSFSACFGMQNEYEWKMNTGLLKMNSKLTS